MYMQVLAVSTAIPNWKAQEGVDSWNKDRGRHMFYHLNQCKKDGFSMGGGGAPPRRRGGGRGRRGGEVREVEKNKNKK